MDFDEFMSSVPKEDRNEKRTNHICNNRCCGQTHYDLLFETGTTYTKEDVIKHYSMFYIKILSAKRVLEYPAQIPGTHVNATGAWGIEYLHKLEVEGIDSYLDGIYNLLKWAKGDRK